MAKEIFFFVFFIIDCISGNEKLCIVQENCEKCLTADYNCGWCTDIEFESTQRCMSKDSLLKAGCPNSKIVINQAESVIVQNKPTQNYQAADRSSIQIQPQKIRIKLVKSRTERIKMTYRPAKMNPLDLYYLMDLTWSMRDDKQTLLKIGEELAKSLQTLTENYRLGYGSFADKPAMPMIMPGYEKNPCKIEKTICEPTYGFHHHLPLTSNIQDFVKKVNTSQVTANLDNLEGGLDALMQVLVCPKQIGWKDEARKIVVLATDGFLHFAGDGRLAGIVKKNDKRCHLNEKGEYTGSLEFDYPSLEEIYRELLKRKINVIFAVTENVRKDYEEIRKIMKEIVGVEILSSDSSNILDLVTKGYQRFTQKVHFIDNSPWYISVTYETDCGNSGDKLRTKNFCDNVEIGKDINFYINITLKDFPDDGVYNHIIRIEDPGISEYLEIELEVQKPCPCQGEMENTQENSPMCNNQGRFHCGMCFCEEGWIGTSCNCDTRNYTSIRALEKNCQQTIEGGAAAAGLSLICSDHGECECGKCYCNRGYNGKYCECPECSDCGDPERVECHCGQCVCKYGWSGKQCNCPQTNEGCISPKGEICSGHGKCECGTCKCDKSYFGRFCEASSLSENNNLCQYYETCVKCLIEQQQQEQQQGINVCSNVSEICSGSDGRQFTYNFTNEPFDKEIFCILPLITKDGEKCRHLYAYSSNDLGISHLMITIANCAPFNIATMGIAIFVATIIFGLAIIVACKIIVYFHDKAEYTRFEKDCVGTSLQENPLFKSPITRYTVPRRSEDELAF